MNTVPTLNRIRPGSRQAVPLPPPPKLADFVTRTVILKEDAAKFDEALQRWWEKVQTAQSMNG